MLKHKPNGKISEIQAYGVGIFTAVIIMLTMLVICTVCIRNEYFTIEFFGPVTLVIQLLSCYSGGKIADVISKEANKKAYIIVGGVLLVLQLAVALTVFEGVSGMYLWLVLATIIAGAGGIFLTITKGKGNKVKHRKKRRI